MYYNFVSQDFNRSTNICILIQIISIKTSIFLWFFASLIDFINGFLLIIITLHTMKKYIYNNKIYIYSHCKNKKSKKIIAYIQDYKNRNREIVAEYFISIQRKIIHNKKYDI